VLEFGTRSRKDYLQRASGIFGPQCTYEKLLKVANRRSNPLDSGTKMLLIGEKASIFVMLPEVMFDLL
jgi:hypothetical protein